MIIACDTINKKICMFYMEEQALKNLQLRLQ
jgi:hypothetical protein